MSREHPEDWKANAADRAAGHAVNVVRARENAEPAGTVSTATTVVRHIDTSAPCSCSCRQWCEADHPSDAA